LLKEFKEEGFIPRGIEPCKRLSDKTNAIMIPTRNGFWTESLSRSARSWSGEDIITATNVFAHVDDLRDFLRAINYQFECNRKGIFIIEVPYFLNLLKNNEFDTVYHEHLSYFLLRPIISILAAHGLRVFKVDSINIHGGSIRIYSSQHDYPMDESVYAFVSEEAKLPTDDYQAYKDVQANSIIVKEFLKPTLQHIKDSGKKVFAYGASAKGCTLLNYCEITSALLPKVVDETVGKIGKYMPGCNIPIVSFSHFETDRPDYILLTAWNFKDEMMKKTRHLGAKYILPIPKVEII
jgi:hypothetical protein